MKNSIKILFVLLLAAGSMSSCMKDNPYDPYDGEAMLEKEAPILKAYVESTVGLAGAKLDTLTGIWYLITEEGVPSTDTAFYKYKYEYNSNTNSGFIVAPLIRVKYEGKLVSNGVVFDKNDKEEGAKFNLGGSIIDGWKIAFIPETVEDESGKVHTVLELIGLPGLTGQGLQKGAKIRLVIPSPYGFQDREQQGIPANSPLDFTIEVLEIVSPRG